MRTGRRTSAAWVAVVALAAGGLAACGGSDELEAGPVTTRRSRFPVAVVPTSTPSVTNPFGGAALVPTTSTTRKPVAATGGGGAATTTAPVTAPPRVRPAETPMPAARTSIAGEAWQGYVVIAGGVDADGRLSSRVDAYDPRAGGWLRAPNLPVPLTDVAMAIQDDDLWVIGGFAAEGEQKIAQAATYRFQPGGKAWEPGPMLDTPRGGAAVGTLNNTLIVIGGATTDGGTLDTVETLALGAEEWQSATPLSQRRAYASAIVGGGRIYTMGGRTEGVASSVGHVESWKPGDAWRAEQALASKRSGAGASGLCVAGGENGDGTVASVECIAARKWSTRFHMSVPRHGLAVVELDGWLHLIGGRPNSGPSVIATHEVFDLR